jgi:hypothetical protein
MPSAGFDAVIDLRSGFCDGTNINCADFKGPGGTESINAGGLLIGNTYIIRVYSFGSGTTAQGTFSICVHGMPPYPPTNDNCTGALIFQYPMPNIGTTASSTQSAGPVDCDGLTGDSDDDVWYQFFASGENYTIKAEGMLNFDPVIDLREGFCDGVTIACADLTGNSGYETLKATGLTPGEQYLVRIYSYGPGTSSQGEFGVSLYESVCETCPAFDFSLSPNTAWMNHSSSLYSLGCNIYQVNVSSGNEYTFKTGCGDGASADFDTYLQLYDQDCNVFLTDDNYCEENRSEITWEATYTGYAYLKVTGTDAAAFGSYVLAYHTPYPLNIKEPGATNSNGSPVGLYPNPASGSFFIESSKYIYVQRVLILDLTGRIVQSINVEQKIRTLVIDDYNLAPGSYFVGIDLSGGYTYRRLEIIR